MRTAARARAGSCRPRTRGHPAPEERPESREDARSNDQVAEDDGSRSVEHHEDSTAERVRLLWACATLDDPAWPYSLGRMISCIAPYGRTWPCVAPDRTGTCPNLSYEVRSGSQCRLCWRRGH